MLLRLYFFALLLLAFMQAAAAVDRSKFRTCKDTLFCRNFRSPESALIAYSVAPGSVRVDESRGELACSLTDGLTLTLLTLRSGAIRLRVTEAKGGKERWKPLDLLEKDALVSAPFEMLLASSPKIPENVQKSQHFSAMAFQEKIILLYHFPLRVEVYFEGELLIAVNDRALMHYELTKSAGEIDLTGNPVASTEDEGEVDRHGGKEVKDYGEDGLAIYADGTKEERRESRALASSSGAESFGGHTDSKAEGAKSVGVDVSFPSARHLYGIPQHATSLALPSTIPSSAASSKEVPSPRYKEPYRMYTLDVFEYEVDEPMALYGNIPLLMAHGLTKNEKSSASAGVFWFNPSETFVDVSDGQRNESSSSLFKESHWMSESGDIDLFLMATSSPKALSAQFASIMGSQQLPPMFALGYHQCRWNYRDQKDVSEVEAKFEELDFPYDVLWLGERFYSTSHYSLIKVN